MGRYITVIWNEVEQQRVVVNEDHIEDMQELSRSCLLMLSDAGNAAVTEQLGEDRGGSIEVCHTVAELQSLICGQS